MLAAALIPRVQLASHDRRAVAMRLQLTTGVYHRVTSLFASFAQIHSNASAHSLIVPNFNTDHCPAQASGFFFFFDPVADGVGPPSARAISFSAAAATSDECHCSNSIGSSQRCDSIFGRPFFVLLVFAPCRAAYLSCFFMVRQAAAAAEMNQKPWTAYRLQGWRAGRAIAAVHLDALPRERLFFITLCCGREEKKEGYGTVQWHSQFGGFGSSSSSRIDIVCQASLHSVLHVDHGFLAAPPPSCM